MQNTQSNELLERRATSKQLDNIEQLIEKLSRDAGSLRKDLESAIPKDEYGNPGYVLHSLQHQKQIKSDQAMEGYKQEATKKLLGIAITGLTILLGSGFIAFLKVKLGL